MNKILILNSKTQLLAKFLESHGYRTEKASCTTISQSVTDNAFDCIIAFISKDTSLETIQKCIDSQKNLILAIAIADSQPGSVRAKVLSSGFDICFSFPVEYMHNYQNLVLAQIQAQERMYRRIARVSRKLSALYHFTPREKDVLSAFKSGCYSDKDIAKKLYMSLRTVQCHMHRIKRKTSMNRVQLFVWLYRYGL